MNNFKRNWRVAGVSAVMIILIHIAITACIVFFVVKIVGCLTENPQSIGKFAGKVVNGYENVRKER